MVGSAFSPACLAKATTVASHTQEAALGGNPTESQHLWSTSHSIGLHVVSAVHTNAIEGLSCSHGRRNASSPRVFARGRTVPCQIYDVLGGAFAGARDLVDCCGVARVKQLEDEEFDLRFEQIDQIGNGNIIDFGQMILRSLSGLGPHRL